MQEVGQGGGGNTHLRPLIPHPRLRVRSLHVPYVLRQLPAPKP